MAGKIYEFSCRLALNNRTIESVKHYQYLGSWINEDTSDEFSVKLKQRKILQNLEISALRQKIRM